MNKTLFYFACFSLIYFSSHFQAAQAQAPAQCNTVYAVHDEGVSETQFFTYDLKKDLFNSLGDKLEAYDIEALDSHPQTRLLFAASGKKEAKLYQVDGDTGEAKLIGDIGFDNVVGLAFHFDGRLVAWSDQGLLELDIDTAEGTLIWPQTEAEKNAFEQFGPFSIYALAWNREGTLLYGVAADNPQASTLWVYDSTGWNVACKGLPKKVESLETLPDDLLLYGFHNDKQLGIHTYNANRCETVADARFNTPYNDIEGIAWPIACTIPSNLEALRAYFESLEGVEAVEITPDGAITITQNGEIHQSQLDELVTKGTPPPDGKLIMEQIEDVNGDGIADFRIIYPSGDRQILYDVESQTPPPVIKIKHAETVVPGDTLPITIESDVALDRLTIVLTVNGTPIEVDAEGHAQFSSDTPGLYLIQVTVTDSKGNSTEASSRFVVTAPNDHTPPVVTLTSPPADAEITAPTEIIGTVSDTYLIGYTLAWSPRGKNSYTTFFNGSSAINNDVLGTLDPSLLMNGLYDIRVTATDANNQTTVVDRVIKVSGDLKVGHFSFTVEDLSIPMMGMPLNVLRTYDTRQKGQALDFGHGWSVNYQSIKVEESRIPGKDWILNQYGFGFMGKLCLEPLGSPQVAVTLPDGQVETFNVHVQPECGPIFQGGPINPVVVFQSQQGTFSKLESLDALGFILFDGNDLIYLSTGQSVNPNRYRLTTQAGYQYELEQDFGIRQVKDPNGHTLTYSKDGIIHSAGKSVQFTRDSSDRITKITDPNGNSLKYEYNTAGDLIASSDAIGNTVGYSYNSTHAMTDIQDPLGRKMVRNLYDDSGRLIAQIDAEGNHIHFNHDIEGREEIIRDRRGFATTYVYDDKGKIVTEIDAKGHVTYHDYDANGNELSRTDPFGHTTKYTYDAHGNVLTKKDPEGHITKSAYDNHNNLLREEYPNDNVLEMSYDTQGNLLKATDPAGHIFEPIYDSAKQATAILNGRGKLIMSFSYNNDGNPISQTDSLGNVTHITYDKNGNELSQLKTRTGADGNPVSFLSTTVYDADGKPTKITDVAGYVTQTEYNAASQVVATVDKNGHRTTFEYDIQGRLIKTNYPDDTSTSSMYDANDNQISFTDRQGQTTQYRYDYQNRLVETLLPDKTSTSREYDAVGQVLAEVDANGNRTTFEYGKGEQPVKITDALGQSIQLTYDGIGNRTSVTDASGQTIRFEYDGVGRPTQVIYADNTFTQVVYDDLGRRVQDVDRAGQVTRYEYDAVGHLTKVIDAEGGETSYLYDEVGNVISETDALDHTTSWTYDNLGRPLSRTLPLNMTETFTYEGNGNVLTHTNFNGDTISYSYDSNNRLVMETYPDESIIGYTYTKNGLPATITDSRGVTHYSYDVHNQLVKVVHPEGATLEYGYDANGNRTFVTTSSGQTTYTYDKLNRLSSVTNSDEGVTSYVYDVVGNLTRVTRPNGTITVYHYDTSNQLVKLEHLNSDISVIGSYEYTLNVLGYPIQVIEPNGRIVAYTYDKLGRLIQEDITDPINGDLTLAYSYDAVSNRVAIQVDGVVIGRYNYDANNRLLTAGDHSYSYDANGNTLTQNGPEGTTTYGYDLKNRLVNVTTPNDSMAYVYDTDGIRIGSTLNEVATHYLVDKNRPYAQVLEERSSENDLLASYTYGNDLLRQKRGSENRYFHYDRLDSTKGLTDDNQTVTDVYHYDAFGNPLQINGATLNHYRFTGEQHDQQTGLIYLRARYYNPSRGRFLTSDTWQGQRDQPITLHKYLYANGNPVVFVDPTGHMSLTSLNATFQIMGHLARTSMLKLARYIIKNKLKGKKFDVFKGTSGIRNVTKAPAHHFVFVEHTLLKVGRSRKPLVGAGWRYDIATFRPRTVVQRKQFKCELLNAFVLGGEKPSTRYNATLMKNDTTRKQIHTGNEMFVPGHLKKKAEAKFTYMQYFLWEMTVYFPYAYEDGKTFLYSFKDRWNCQNWTRFALWNARLIQKMRVYP